MPLMPTSASLGTPSASSAARRALETGPTVPSAAFATSPSGESRVVSPDGGDTAAPAGLSASTLPSRASSVARRGSVTVLDSASPGRSPGNRSVCDQRTRSAPPSSTSFNSKLRCSTP